MRRTSPAPEVERLLPPGAAPALMEAEYKVEELAGIGWARCEHRRAWSDR